ncbi:hypothetical protein Asppvi_001703 [Aspergillus pseudoviridinutans]|uniref:Uncharacterized protein n=1 Tax=Aspergillus pseudoviridinutans TaxID=1517512 RepID=A0A9P3EPY1_9EURO|nr:uncharacterized protein Asppvi_001703 [Aspergillus pseudoviridinutans]GIJ83184.1 hypothetical protein Asppvi_001703 [Aspergillus pseudoviridinutans]
MARILVLPIELRVSILQELSDIGDLSAALSSHRLLAEALRESPTIVGHVLGNEIDPRLWPVAVMIWQMRTHRKDTKVHDEQDALSILEECQNTTPQEAWKYLNTVDLAEAHKYSHQLQRAIDKFTTDFISMALDFLTIEGVLDHSSPAPSPTEAYRVQRAFYFFEFFCCLWDGGPYIVDWDRQWSLPLYVGFDPWINEQLASVYEYLLRQLTIAFNDVYRIRWGTLNTADLEPDYENAENAFLVSRGINYVYKLTRAPTREARCRLLVAETKPGKSFLLNVAIEDLNDQYYHERHTHRSPLFGAAYMRALQDRSQHPDVSTSDLFLPDLGKSGPAEIWCQAHLSDDHAQWGSDFVLSKNFAHERKAGYVMWDACRILDFENFKREKDVSNRNYQ